MDADNKQADIASSSTSRATEALIDRFGGIRPMAAKLGIPVTTVQGWKKRGAIPAARHGDILAAAEINGLALETIELAATEPDLGEGGASDEFAMPAGAPVTVPVFAWIGAAIGGFMLLALLVMLLALYIVKQKTADLSHRVNMLEEQAAQAVPGTANQASASSQETQSQASGLAVQAAQVAGMMQRLQTLETAGGSREAMGQTISGVQQTVAGLQGTIQTLSQFQETTRQKLNELETSVAQRKAENARNFAMLLAIDQLRAAARTSQPFDTELGAARTIARDDPAMMKDLDTLSDYAGDGAATMNELRVEFSDLASEIVRSNVVGDGSKWWRQALYRLASVISVRRIGTDPTAPVSSAEPEILVSRAESRLEEDDLPGAVEALAGLQGLPHDVAAAWVDSASRRIAIDQGLATLGNAEMEKLNGMQATPGAYTPAGAGSAAGTRP